MFVRFSLAFFSKNYYYITCNRKITDNELVNNIFEDRLRRNFNGR